MLTRFQLSNSNFNGINLMKSATPSNFLAAYLLLAQAGARDVTASRDGDSAALIGRKSIYSLSQCVETKFL